MKPMYYVSSLRIPAGKSGKFSIVHKLHPKGKPVPEVNMKMAFFLSEKPNKYIYPTDVIFHTLREGESLWMSDYPSETFLHESVIKQLSGKVLIAGLGLGYTPTELSKKKSIKQIDVVEISSDVVNLVWKHIKTSKMNIIQDDFFKYLKSCSNSYDFIYVDIFGDYNEDLLFTHVLPIMKLINNRGICSQDNVVFWAFDIMIGQLKFDLLHSVQMLKHKRTENMSIFKKLTDDSGFINNLEFCRTKVPFYKWFLETKPSSSREIKEGIKRYCRWGTKEWFKEFGKYVDIRKCNKECLYEKPAKEGAG